MVEGLIGNSPSVGSDTSDFEALMAARNVYLKENEEDNEGRVNMTPLATHPDGIDRRNKLMTGRHVSTYPDSQA